MKLRFEMLYRLRNKQGQPRGAILRVETVQEDPSEVRRQFEGQPIEILAVNVIMPVIDWGQPVFDRSEAAVYLRSAESKVDAMMGEGTLPKKRDGRPLFTAGTLKHAVMARMIYLDPKQEAAA